MKQNNLLQKKFKIIFLLSASIFSFTSCVPSGQLTPGSLISSSTSISSPAASGPLAPAKPTATPTTAPTNDGGNGSGSGSGSGNMQPDYEGIVGLGNCSGALIIFRGQPTSSKGMVLTNGHCLSDKLGEVPDMFRTFKVKYNATINKRTLTLFKTKSEKYPLSVVKIIYGTMTNTDAALYETSETYDDIEKRTGVEPLVLDDQKPEVGISLEIISGLHSKEYYCKIEKFVPKLSEDLWTWEESIKYTKDRCDIIPGTSGSPIINIRDREVVGVNNTKNDDGKQCTFNNPCEKDATGKVTSYKQGDAYGQQTYLFYGCINKNTWTIDLAQSGCFLPKN